MSDDRPNPDELLARVQAEEREQSRGKLRIFLGYAAGVGKTYAMLEAGQQRKTEGLDVVIAYVETHRRPDTEAMAEGLEIVLRKAIERRGVSLTEMDVDAVLRRRPALALVDELAHTNAPGSRHPKRYLDVQELLDAGIDVYTTLNIQHLESLNDVITQITGVQVQETIPDRVIDEATDLELVDLPPDELLDRLREGKVYIPDQAARAIRMFFRKGNLTALREMSMRRAAERVDEQMRAYMQVRAIPGPWSASERILVCVSPSSLSERLVRTGRRLADALNAEWFAVHVETTGVSRAERDRAARTLQLAEELGAKALTLPGGEVAEATLAYARQHNITKIVVGKPLRPRLAELLQGSVVDRLIRAGGTIDVYVISGGSEEGLPAAPRRWRLSRPWRRYGESAAMVVVATLLGFVIDPVLSSQKWAVAIQTLTTGRRPSEILFGPPALEPTNVVMIYLAAVVMCAVYLGRGPAILASGLSVVAFDFFFVAPYLTFAVSDTQYVLTFIGLFVVGVVISTLASRLRGQMESAQQSASETTALYELSRDLSTAGNPDEVLAVILRNVGQTFGRDVAILLPEDGSISPRAASAGLEIDESERAVADWVFRHGEPAGRHTDTLGGARLRYLPLRTSHGVVGVLGVKGPSDEARHLTPEQRRLMEAFASQAALAIERVQLEQQAQQAQLLQATERLQAALLNSISHDLRTPLVSIIGALSSLDEDAGSLDASHRRPLLENARAEAERLNRLVGNLLDMTRLEAGALIVAKEPCEIEDVIGAALQPLAERIGHRPVQVDAPPDLPLVPVDFVLMTQVLMNLVDNAVKYSAAEAPIEIRARVADDQLRVEIADHGIGIPTGDLERVFDKFYRVQRPGRVSGTGLGLSIARGMVEAHGGTIQAMNRPGGGTVMTVRLPLR